MGPVLLAIPQPSMGRGPEMRSGINFGPGRSNRIPDQGSPEYEQLLNVYAVLAKCNDE
jgi:hypothetical protein